MENARVAGPRREVSHRRNQRTLTRARAGLESYDLTRTQFDPVSIDATPVLSTLVWNDDSIFALWARFVKDRQTDRHTKLSSLYHPAPLPTHSSLALRVSRGIELHGWPIRGATQWTHPELKVLGGLESVLVLLVSNAQD